MLNNKPHCKKINYAYTLLSSDNHTHADDQTTDHVATCWLCAQEIAVFLRFASFR